MSLHRILLSHPLVSTTWATDTMQRQKYKFYVKQKNIFGIICKNQKKAVSCGKRTARGGRGRRPTKKEQALQKGERSLQTGRKVLGNREKGTFWLVAIARPFMLGRTAESGFYSVGLSFFRKYSQRRLSRTFRRRG